MNTKMKVLSLAMFGLVGTAFAGSAAAVCPASPVPPWTAAPALQGTVVIADGGLAGTECRMDSTIDAGGSSAAFATVQDDSPATETQYRAQFIVDLDALAATGPSPCGRDGAAQARPLGSLPTEQGRRLTFPPGVPAGPGRMVS
jgi:hypothetical protein